MKKSKMIVLLPVLLIFSSTLISCGNSEQPLEKQTFSIVFKQNGVEDIIKTVKEGENLVDIPNPTEKTGYSVIWDMTNFNNITSNLIINAIETPNVYQITYNAPGFLIDGNIINLTYDAKCDALDMSLFKEDYVFVGWSYNDSIFTNDSIWNIADNVTLTPIWEESKTVKITFIDSDGSTILKEINKGETLEDIPAPTFKEGYNVSWDVTDFTNVSHSFIVNAILIPKSFTLLLNPNGGVINKNSLVVTFDEPYSLEEPVNDEYLFEYWEFDDIKVPLNGIWNIDSNSNQIELIAVWGGSVWTDIV